MSRGKRNLQQLEIKLPKTFSSDSSENQFLRIIRGMILPLIIAVYGLYACIMQNAILPGKRGKLLELNNTTAVSYGIALIGLAVFLHFVFWWNTEHQKYQVAKICAIAAIIIFFLAFSFTFWRIIFYCESSFV